MVSLDDASHMVDDLLLAAWRLHHHRAVFFIVVVLAGLVGQDVLIHQEVVAWLPGRHLMLTAILHRR